ncbi:hypothetical protein AB1K54_01385 [Microbacterium sp. BWT-B31]|uniref:hypothetical protein n=1 Tax=Microbacterium sp. BWT-B31 TaxID=3232072 RepID=UPI0035294F6E
MDTPKYLQTLWQYKWLLLFGAIVAAVAAFFAGFAIQNGQVVSRAETTYSAATTMLVTSPNDTLYQAEVPGMPVQEGMTQPQEIDLAQNALLYAYLISSDTILQDVEAAIGPLDDEKESLSGLRRTTQPAGDERFPGRYELPVLEAIGIAPTQARAELISRTAADAFLAYLALQQDEQGIDPAQRVEVELLAANDAVEGDGSNPAIPIVVTFLGVLLAFVVLIYLIAGARSGAAKRKAAKASAAADDVATGDAADDAEPPATSDEPAFDETLEPLQGDRELVTTSTGSLRARRGAGDGLVG